MCGYEWAWVRYLVHTNTQNIPVVADAKKNKLRRVVLMAASHVVTKQAIPCGRTGVDETHSFIYLVLYLVYQPWHNPDRGQNSRPPSQNPPPSPTAVVS